MQSLGPIFLPATCLALSLLPSFPSHHHFLTYVRHTLPGNILSVVGVVLCNKYIITHGFTYTMVLSASHFAFTWLGCHLGKMLGNGPLHPAATSTPKALASKPKPSNANLAQPARPQRHPQDHFHALQKGHPIVPLCKMSSNSITHTPSPSPPTPPHRRQPHQSHHG